MRNVLLSLPLLAAGCGDASALGEPITADNQSLALECPPDVPASLKVPDGNELRLVADAEGVQVYICQVDSTDATLKWILERPDALLFGKQGRVIAHHYEGPTWEGLDGSTVVGMALEPRYTPDPTAIPWLLLKANGNGGDGMFSKITYIQRLHTEQGKPQTVCDSATFNKHVRVPYTATYYFYAAADSGKPNRH